MTIVHENLWYKEKHFILQEFLVTLHLPKLHHQLGGDHVLVKHHSILPEP